MSNLQDEKDVISEILTRSKIVNRIVGDEIHIGNAVFTFNFIFWRIVLPLLLLVFYIRSIDPEELPRLFIPIVLMVWLFAGIIDWSRRSSANTNRKVIRPGSITVFENKKPVTIATEDIEKINVQVVEHTHTMCEGEVYFVLKNGLPTPFLRLESLVAEEMQEMLLDMKACLQTYLALPSTLETKVMIKYKQKIVQARKD